MSLRTVAYKCEVCDQPASAPADNALAMLHLCKGCGEKRYRKGKAEQRKALASSGATNATGEVTK